MKTDIKIIWVFVYFFFKKKSFFIYYSIKYIWLYNFNQFLSLIAFKIKSFWFIKTNIHIKSPSLFIFFIKK